MQSGVPLNSFKILCFLMVLGLCLFQLSLRLYYELIQDIATVLFGIQWALLGGVSTWFIGIFLLTFNPRVSLFIGLLALEVVACCICSAHSWEIEDAVVFLFSVTFGKCCEFSLNIDHQRQMKHIGYNFHLFLLGLVGLLLFSSFWHLNTADNFYRGPRWMGLWNNPNDYGMLMGAGVLLAIGLLAGSRKPEVGSQKLDKASRGVIPRIFLLIATGMMSVGLVMSYSRGAWLGTAIGLLYLAWCYGKLKWKYIVIGVGLLALGTGLFWGRTPDSAPWYLKRADLGRPSAQHRASAWRAGLEIMRDHPFGVGWNNAVSLYDKQYSPPEGGAAAITTNDYLMIGTELGIPALLCFMAYVGLCYWKSPKIEKLEVGRQELESAPSSPPSPPMGEKVSAGRMRGKRCAPLVYPARWCSSWRSGLTAGCSNYLPPPCSGFCWNWERTGQKVENGVQKAE